MSLKLDRSKTVLCWLHYLILVICYGAREAVGEKDSDQLEVSNAKANSGNNSHF